MKKAKLFYSLILLCLPFAGISQSVTTYSRTGWTVTPSSEELTGEGPVNGPAAKMLDGDNSTYWVSNFTDNFEEYPHALVFDMQVAQPVNRLYYVPRDNGATSAYSGSVSFGDDGINFGTEVPVIFSKTFEQNFIVLPSTQNHRYFRITINQNQSDHDAGTNSLYITTMAEVGAIFDNTLDAGLTSFTVQAQAGGVKLDWSTSFEFNSTNYNITRSNDAVNFTTIGTLAATGTATTAATYTFTDAAPLTGFNFYRLELANSTGPATKSTIKNAEFPLITYSSSQPKNLNVFYFIPAGKAPWPDFKNRLDTLLINLQTYYKDEMQRNGRGSRTFGMVTDATHKKVKIIVVHGKYPISNYLSIGGGGTAAIQAEIDAYMAANPSPYYSSHSLMIAPVVGYDVATATIDEGVPVGGTGKNCHVIDNPELKWSWLGRDDSPESFNATYQIGAWAHEFGHAVGLPHNFLKVSEEPTLGTSLMSNGNSTFGRTTTSLTSTDAAILNHNQLFNDGSISYYGPNHASISSIHACYSASKNAIIVAGRVSTIGAQVTDVEIYNDPSNGSAPGVGDNNDYDAVAWTTPIIGTDSFYVEMPVTELQVRDSSLYQMRFRLVQLDGNLSDVRYNYDFANNIPELTDPAFSPINAKITASVGANGSIAPAGVTTISCVGNQTYTITPNAGYAVQSVLVDGAPAGAITTYTFTGVNTQHTISASFVAVVVNYTITATSGANGTVTPGGATSVASGANQTYTIAANAGYSIANVLVDGVSVGAVGTYTFTNVTAAHTISASFVAVVVNYTITASAGSNGSISPSGAVSVASGTNRTFAITANAGYTIANVLVDGVSVGVVGTYTFTNVTAAHTISANFVAVVVNYTITASAGSNGSISPSGAVSVASGTNRTFTITANAGYVIAGVLVDGVSAGAVGTYTFTNVTAAHTISATFTITTTACVKPTLKLAVINVTCKGSSTGAISLTTTGGSSPFTYAWTGPNSFTAIAKDISGLKAGTYTVKVTATGGCFATASCIVSEPAAAVNVNAAYNKIQCTGGTTSVIVTATGGTAPYTGIGTLPNQSAGSHTYTVTDAKGCTASKTIVIEAGTGTAPGAQTITGAAAVTAGQTNVQYSVPCVSGQSYTWVVPQGATITSGAGTCTIKVRFASSCASGYVKVAVCNACGSAKQATKYVTVRAAALARGTVTETNFVETDFLIYPNPVSSIGTFTFNAINSNDKFEISIIAMNGKRIYSKTGYSIAGKNKISFDMSGYASGTYLVTLFTNNTKQTLKLIKGN